MWCFVVVVVPVGVCCVCVDVVDPCVRHHRGCCVLVLWRCMCCGSHHRWLDGVGVVVVVTVTFVVWLSLCESPPPVVLGVGVVVDVVVV